MTVITPESVEGRVRSKPEVTLKKDGVYINRKAVKEFDLSEGNTIQFLNDGMMWLFAKVIGTPGIDVFILSKRGTDDQGLWVCSRGLSARILSSMGIGPTDRLIRMAVKTSSIEFKGTETIEIVPTSRAKK